MRAVVPRRRFPGQRRGTGTAAGRQMAGLSRRVYSGILKRPGVPQFFGNTHPPIYPPCSVSVSLTPSLTDTELSLPYVYISKSLRDRGTERGGFNVGKVLRVPEGVPSLSHVPQNVATGGTTAPSFEGAWGNPRLHARGAERRTRSRMVRSSASFSGFRRNTGRGTRRFTRVRAVVNGARPGSVSFRLNRRSHARMRKSYPDCVDLENTA